MLGLPEDALKPVLCCLPAADLGRMSMTCTQMNQALFGVRVSYLLSRLRSARLGKVGMVEMCENEEEARLVFPKMAALAESSVLLI